MQPSDSTFVRDTANFIILLLVLCLCVVSTEETVWGGINDFVSGCTEVQATVAQFIRTINNTVLFGL